ncbi:tetratricopeptide repeat protein [Amycolatopsis sp., V23-08]|uniref:Tetratricopeptide repeat protein n=1 Tax=Amycolatopsis heterodermiae TaxID=3110235 RepID=A0ABU5RLW9_9PSEU|nr:tetratricopeptide repeat protein [Amycolatopsis sp., V23-08]MEA5367188.1 tetratricopeptide repeat protein [Amycolatopsis sp., V23-08]
MPAVHRTILVVDVERYGSPARSDLDRVAVRAGLYAALEAAFAAAAVVWAGCDRANSGDGVLVVIPPTVPKSVFVQSLPGNLIAELRRYNERSSAARRVRLRMALHAGEVVYDDHGVVGTAVNHTFRLVESPAFRSIFARSGGELGLIVSSWIFEEVVRNGEPGEADAYRPVQAVVKETETTAWVRVWDGQATAPPSTSAAPRQLPPGNRHFVGRAAELDLLTSIVAHDDAPTVVITAIAGTAGIGKTTLATRWANAVRHRFPDGQLHVDLRGFDHRAELDPAQVLHGFLEALGVAPSAMPGDLDGRSARYRSLLADRRVLVLLDNARSASQVRPLLPNSPTCLVLVTSRDRLDSLVVHEGAHRLNLDLLPKDDAVRVLGCHIAADRMAAEPDAVADLVELCARLPLALSIVAARAANQPALPLGRLAGQLRDERARLDTLDLGGPDLSFRAVASWSVRVLSPQAARLFRLLGVHPGPDIDALACAALLGNDRVGPLLTELTAAHLVEEHLPGRYGFHDLLRVYARECAETDEPDLDAVKARVIDYYVTAVSVADRYILPCREGVIRPRPSAEPVPHLSGYHDAMAWLAEENATVLAVLEFAGRAGFTDRAGRLAWTITSFLNRTGQRHERAAVHRAALAAATDDGSRLTASLGLARALIRLERYEEAQALLDGAGELAEGAGHDGRVSLLMAYTTLFELQERYAEALPYVQRVWALVADRPNPLRHADALAGLARQLTWLDSPAEAVRLAERALALYRRVDHPDGTAFAAMTLGSAHRRLGEYQRALEWFELALTLDRELGVRYWAAQALNQLGDVHDLLGATAEAMAAWAEAAAILEAQHHPEGASVRAKIDRAGRHGQPMPRSAQRKL